MPPEPLSTLDLISWWMDTPERRLDFSVRLGLRDPRPLAELEAGAARARAAFPRSSAAIGAEGWTPAGLEGAWATVAAEAIEAELARPLDPCQGPSLRQLAVPETDGCRTLITRSHHAAADLGSAFSFLGVQLGAEPKAARLQLRSHPRPLKKSGFAQPGPSTRAWVRRPAPSGARRVRRWPIDAAPFRLALAGAARGCSYNDLLGTCALFMLRGFQEAHGAATEHLSLWFPISLRPEPFAGYGNGASRVRIYGRPLWAESILESARGFRAQVEWAMGHGEWAVPTTHPFLKLPRPLQRPLVRAYLRRPWVDMGTMLYSHLGRLGPYAEAFEAVDTVEVEATLDRRHPFGLAGVSLGDRTQLSLTYDPAQLDDADVDQLEALFREALAQAQRELGD